jgi:succinoglycan biosynthesis protein ExoM
VATRVGAVRAMEARRVPDTLPDGARLPLVSVCVATFRRPDGLRRLVRSLAMLRFTSHPARIELNVVDNDPAGRARGVCAALRREVSFPIKCEVEPRRGISFARNRSVRMADPASDFVVFVDDDETVAPSWLDELLRVQRVYDADVVTGPAMPEFTSPPPTWIVKGQFFDPLRFATGKRLEHAFTNNVLVRVAVLRKMAETLPQPLPVEEGGYVLFDERLGLTGGEDTHFFRRVSKAGFTIVWADEAVVHDFIPRSRMNTRWLLQRAFRYGAMTPVIARDVRPAPEVAHRWLGIAAVRIVAGMLPLPISWLFGWHQVVRSLRYVSYLAGALSGLCGLRYQEYRRTHGR